MRVSALIPTYNRREYIGRCLQSVLSQTSPVDEIIVVDDGSTDGTAEFVQREFGSTVRVVLQENQGVSAARRRLVREAQGDWVAFLDSDDEWTPDRNRVFAEAARAVPNDVAWIFGNLQLIQDNGDQETTFGKFGLRLNQNPTVFADPIAVQHPFQYGMLQASLIRREALEAVGAFQANLAHSEDYLTGVQVACRYKYAAVPAVVAKLYRTADLKETSLDLAGQKGPDYHRARVLAYSLIVQSGRKHPFAALHEASVRSLCKVLLPGAESVRRLAWEQFRYGVSLKSIVFMCFAAFDQPGIRFWKQIVKTFRPPHKSPAVLSLADKTCDKLRHEPALQVRGEDRS
jgi:glycosyltransferase involved in cell wall biosynthesis